MNGSRDQLNKLKIIDVEQPASKGVGRDATSEQACKCVGASASEWLDQRARILSDTMKSEQDEKRHMLKLSKSQKPKFKKNKLWDKNKRNGKVKCITPENYQKRG